MEKHGNGSIESEDKVVDLRRCNLMEFERTVPKFHDCAIRSNIIRLRIEHEESKGNKDAVRKLNKMLEDCRMEKAVIVVDMINDFMHPDGVLFIGDKSIAAKLVVALAEYLEKAREEGSQVIYACDNHRKDDKEFRLFGEHAVEGTWGAEIIEGLAPVKGDLVIPKTRYSAFYGTNLPYELTRREPEKVVVTGVCTEICVMDTAQGVSYRGYNLAVPSNLCAGLSEDAHNAALERMKAIYGADTLPVL